MTGRTFLIGVQRHANNLPKASENLERAFCRIEYHPVGRGHPVSQDKQARGGHGHVHTAVVMAEDKVVHRIVGLVVLAELVEGFIGPFEGVGDGLFRPGTLAPAGGPLEGDPGVQGGEKHLRPMLAEDSFHEFVPVVAGAQAVSVAQAEAFAAYLHHMRLLQLDHAQLLEVVEGPEVVVALEEVHFYAGVNEVRDGPQHADAALGHHVAVFVPEVEDVAQQVQGLGFRRVYALEKLGEFAFALRRVSRREAQMHVGRKVCQVFGHQANMKIKAATRRQ